MRRYLHYVQGLSVLREYALAASYQLSAVCYLLSFGRKGLRWEGGGLACAADVVKSESMAGLGLMGMLVRRRDCRLTETRTHREPEFEQCLESLRATIVDYS